MNLLDFKNQFYRSDLVHLNNAGLQPISLKAKNKIEYWAQRFWQEGFYTDFDYMKDVANTRQNLAQLIGCQSSELAFFSSTAGGINQIALHFPLAEEDQVLMWDQEYASHLYPWKEACDRSGAELVLLDSGKNLETSTDQFLASITENTKVVAFSWMQYQSGAMMDVETVIKECKRRGIFVFVDIMQGLGFFDCDVWKWGADAVAGGSHKWLVSPVGAGYLAIRDEWQRKFKPHSIGSLTYGTCDDPSDFLCEPKRDATKYEPGSKQVLEITAMGASVELIQAVTPSVIRDEANRLALLLREGLTNLNYEVVCPNGGKVLNSFVNFRSRQGESLNKIAEKLKHHKINLAIRGPGIRLSTQAFNNDADIQLVLETLSTK